VRSTSGPGFTDVPVRLLTSPTNAAGLRARSAPTGNTEQPAARLCEGGGRGAHTTHFSVLDAEGNRVGGTITLNGWFGAGIVVRAPASCSTTRWTTSS